MHRDGCGFKFGYEDGRQQYFYILGPGYTYPYRKHIWYGRMVEVYDLEEVPVLERFELGRGQIKGCRSGDRTFGSDLDPFYLSLLFCYIYFYFLLCWGYLFGDGKM